MGGDYGEGGGVDGDAAVRRGGVVIFALADNGGCVGSDHTRKR